MQVIKSIIFLTFFGLMACTSHAQDKEVNTKPKLKMENQKTQYGIEGHQAPELNVKQWIDGKGNERGPVKLSDYEGKFKVIYCFQSWCPGCHSQGLPALKKMVDALGNNNDKVAFLAIQTVFEGKSSNTYEKLIETQKQYDIQIPFGQDEGDETTRNVANTMYHYRTGGTPWFIFIDQNNNVVFNDFHINAEKAIEYLEQL